MTSRRLTQTLPAALVALTWWTLVSRPGVVDPAFAGTIYVAMFAVTVVVFGVLFLALRVATGGSVIYWSTNRRDQVRPIGWMIVAGVAVMLAAGSILAGLGLFDVGAAWATSLLAWTLVPAAFLQFKWVIWPTRLSRPGPLKLLLFGVVAICVAAAWSYAAFSAAPAASRIPWDESVIVSLGAVIVGATAEEVIFRVLLLTALLDRTGSRLQAVFLSSVAFGLTHVPGEMAQSVAAGDWTMIQLIAHEYAPQFLIQTLTGLFLGVIWLRTGSIVLIAATHALFNTGGMLASGF
ncbi:hypothetical protein GCM10009116_09140 [Brevundimonas basaltis]|uniref:Membrane protease YdiL (CAAX protease family) n=1 Tax=Brevundimonas basaltis TaxID=472166 RepID=A0A7W8HYB2_9CAUL|nr:CPBP family intramembrane glutamic endopeptidase [Brevundimonas basaltis]MBB5292159.1 membrane protease YdiL (CAAX protease family) [Brevundimonas basaltis]